MQEKLPPLASISPFAKEVVDGGRPMATKICAAALTKYRSVCIVVDSALLNPGKG